MDIEARVSGLAGASPSLTPTGTQSLAALNRRRLIVAGLNVVAYLALAAVMAVILGAGGWSAVDVALFVCFLAGTPWTVLGFWNALIGLWLLHGGRDAMAEVAPFAREGDSRAPIAIRTAITMTLRNEDPARAFRRLKAVKDSLDASGEGGAFSYFLLSDSNRPDVAAAEEAAFAAWRAADRDADRLVYRRRTDNTGFKAGNVRDFLDRWGDEFELMLPLDADSLMEAQTIVRHVRIMQAHPKLGILQSLVVGLPSRSAFARIFQFGMRQGMRAYTMGQAWWVGECGPFWGHNALVRIKPFKEECHLPVLPGKPPFGGHILSHDQVEATLMRRAGYEVRVMPEEGGSWEENPPTILDFTKRDSRWCQGNLQYFKLLDTPGLFPVSRFQLIWAILMFIGIPAWTLLVPLAALKPFDGEDPALFPAGLALILYLGFLVMSLMPKLAGIADILLTKGKAGAAGYGGRLRFTAGAATEIVFSFLLGAVSTFRTSFFMAGLLLGRAATWSGQDRDAYGLSWRTAAEGLWKPTLFGIAVLGLMAATSIEFALWSLPLTAGFVLAIPFAVWTSNIAFGESLARAKLCAIPEEFDTPAIVARIESEER